MNIRANGLNFNVWVDGDPAATSVLLLHGWPDSSQLWKAQVRSYVGQEIGVRLFSLPKVKERVVDQVFRTFMNGFHRYQFSLVQGFVQLLQTFEDLAIRISQMDSEITLSGTSCKMSSQFWMNLKLEGNVNEPE